MKSEFPKKGIIAALYLPFDPSGQLMTHELQRHIRWLRKKGIHGFLALGSSGNFPFLSLSQRIEVMTTVKKAAGSLPVIANISDLSPNVVKKLAGTAHKLNLAGIALMPPSFYPCSDSDQLAFFLSAAEAAHNLPLLLYNFPELTGNRISLATIAATADRSNLCGIKQSGDEFSYYEPLIALGKQKGFSIFSGADTRLPEVFRLGADGCIGGCVNVVPELMLEQYRHAQENLSCDTELTASRMKTLGSILSKLSFPLNLAAAMEARGFETGAIFPILSETSKCIKCDITDELRKQFNSWNFSPV